MRLLILENQRLRKTFRPSGETVTIGSDEKCQVHLPDPRICKHQADLLLDDDGNWWLEVRDGATPTCLNRAVQKTRSRLRHADEIEIGEFALRFYVESEKSVDELRHDRMQQLSKTHDDNLPLDTIIHKDEPEIHIAPQLLTQISQLLLALSPIDNPGDTFVPILQFAIRTLRGSKAWIGVRKPDSHQFDWMLGLSAGGKPCDRPSYSTLLEPRCLIGHQHLCVPTVPSTGVASAMAAPLHGNEATLGMIYIETADTALQYGEAELMSLAGITRVASARIDAMLHGAAAKLAATITTEHAIARQTQDAVTISAIPTFDGLQAAAYRHVGESSCSDYYDIVTMRNKRAAIVVAKIEADLLNTPRFFAELRAAFRYAALYQEAPHTFCRALNWLLFNQHGNRIHMMVAQIDPATGQVDYCITGRRVHTGRISDNGDGELIQLAGFPAVGIERAPAYELNQLMLESGQSLLICTDGAKKAINREGQSLGIGGIEEEVRDGLGDTPGHVLRDFAADLDDYLDGGSHPEDLTAILARRE